MHTFAIDATCGMGATMRQQSIWMPPMHEREIKPIQGPVLDDILEDLQRIIVTASSLSSALEPLSDDDLASGMEPIPLDQIKGELEKICHIATEVAINRLNASSDEWYAAADKMS